MKINPLYQGIALGLVLFAGVVFAYYQFLLKPINAQIVKLQGDLDAKKKSLDDAKKIVAKYVEFKKHSDSVQRELEWIQNRLPKTIDKNQFLENINLIQSRSGIVLTSFQFTGQLNARDTYVEVPVSLRFNTDYDGLMRFLYQSSVSPLLMTVSGITLSAFSDPNQPDLTLSVQLFLNGIQAK